MRLLPRVLSNGIFTAGKTGTTDENTNRWFVGFTPYYSAAVWYGYDTPQEIAGGNPCVGTFRAVMNKAHQQLNERRSISTPSGVAYIDYCTVTGKRAGEHCPVEGYYFKSNNLPGQCTSEHEDLKTEEEGEEGAEGEDGEGTETPTPSATTGTTPPPPTSGTLEE